jgi:hypothetical protein
MATDRAEVDVGDVFEIHENEMRGRIHGGRGTGAQLFFLARFCRRPGRGFDELRLARLLLLKTLAGFLVPDCRVVFGAHPTTSAESAAAGNAIAATAGNAPRGKAM